MWIQDIFLKSNKPYWYIMDEAEYMHICNYAVLYKNTFVLSK